MTTEIEIDGIQYELEVETAVDRGCLTKKHVAITDIEVGDVFRNNYGDCYVIILCAYDRDCTGLWYIAGLDDGLRPYSKFGIGTTKEKLIEFINDTRKIFVRNINEDVKTLVTAKT